MSRWWRAYDEAVDNPKLQKLPAEIFRGWFNVCCITSQNGGVLPSIEDIAFKLRTTPAKAGKLIEALRAAGLIDVDGDGNMAPHNWDARQFKGDNSNERVKRYRDRKRNVTCNVTDENNCNAPETEQSRTEQKEDAPSGASSPPKYVFEAGIIRLTKRDFDRWQEAFANLQLKAELISLSQWAEGQGKNWFHAVSGALAKRNREIGEARKIAVLKQPERRGIEGIV